MLTGQVFVSHTSDMAQIPEDRSFVRAALDAVNRAGMAPVDMRYFAARNDKPADYCRTRVRECEVYVAVIGFRYGSIVPGEAVSYTELEFNAAGTAGLPRLVFLLDDTADVPGARADRDRGAIDGFRQRLCEAGLVLRGFNSDASLELEVFHALAELSAGARSAAGRSLAATRYSLPPDTAEFTGRDEELHLIDAAVAGAAGVVAAHVIGGMPGVGKTAFVVHVAHRLEDRYPDGQLFIDLQAHTPGQSPVLPQAALAGLLAAIGIDIAHLPDDLEGRSGMWRERMSGRRTLLVLDNATSSAQVAPLLPMGNETMVLVTSRRHLGDLPGLVEHVLLDVLPPDQAQAMFMRLAPRATRSPMAVANLVNMAGYLPLAISLLARLCARHPAWTLAEVTSETESSILTLTAEKDSVAAAFDVSYRSLARGQQLLLRRLGLHLGTTIDSYAAAALAGITSRQAGILLDALHGEGLLTETGHRRYSMHDLIRRYARERAAGDVAANRERTLDLLLDYYQYTAASTEALVARQSRTTPASATLSPPPAEVPDLQDRSQALSWARAERINLLACLDYATQNGLHDRTVALTANLAALLRQDGPWAEAITRHTTAVQAARYVGDRLGEANALNDQADVWRLIGEYRAAAAARLAALAIFCEDGDTLGEANALTGLGLVRYFTDDYPGAMQVLERSLNIYRDLGNRQGQANALAELGAVRPRNGDYPGATQALEAALQIYRDIDDRQGEANALNYLAQVRRLTGDYQAAIEALQEALAIFQDVGNQSGQANALTELGAVRPLTGDYPGATQALQAALRICRDAGDRGGEASALGFLGVALRLAGDYPGAAEALEAALVTFQNVGNRGDQANALNDLGSTYRLRGDLTRAMTCHRQALDLARDIRSSWDEAHALAGLGRLALATGDTVSAKADLQRALSIFERIGTAEAADLAAELDALPETPRP